MTGFYTSKGKKSKIKHSFSKSNRTNCEEGEILCFSCVSVLNDKKNLKYFNNLTCLDKADSIGDFSGCHKIKKNFYLIDNDQDGRSPTVYSVQKTTKKSSRSFFISCGLWHPGDYFETALKIKKEYFATKLTIKDNTLVFFVLPDVNNKSCKTQFNKRDLKKFSENFNNFSINRIELDKFEEFNVPNGTYNIYTFFHGDSIGGHFIELRK